MATKQKAKTNIIHTIGRRKESVARVYLTLGAGNIEVNSKPLKQYFGETTVFPSVAKSPLSTLDVLDMFDIKVNVGGGGPTGQSGAISLGIARALDQYEQSVSGVSVQSSDSDDEDGEDDATVRPWRKKLKAEGLMARDARVVERKKVGYRKARKKEQYSKR